jgi:L-fuconolactonase
MTSKLWTNVEVDVWLLRSGRPEVAFPQVPFVDSHHHVFPMSRQKAKSNTYVPKDAPLSTTFGRAPLIGGYTREDWQNDANGLNVCATVYIEAHVQYDSTLVEPSVGETRFAKAVFESDPKGVFCKGIVAAVDLTRTPLEIEELIDMHCEALKYSGTRLCGVRMQLANAKGYLSPFPKSSFDQLAPGANAVGSKGLPLDVWLYYHQLIDLAWLAKSCPATTFVCDHVGTPIGADDFVFQEWKRKIKVLADCPNVIVKIGKR